MAGRLETLKQLVQLDDPALTLLLGRAEAYVLAETNRTIITPAMDFVVVEVAYHMHTRDVASGLTAKSEGGISESYSEGFPPAVLNALKNFRIARVNGHAFE